jgi:hypothetical protein
MQGEAPLFLELPETSFAASISHFGRLWQESGRKVQSTSAVVKKQWQSWQSDCHMFPATFEPQGSRLTCPSGGSLHTLLPGLPYRLARCRKLGPEVQFAGFILRRLSQ